MEKALVLLSGGIDSAVVLASVVQSKSYQVHTVGFHYQQRHSYELEKAHLLSEDFMVTSHRVVVLPRLFGSPLVDDRMDLPTDRTPEEVNSGVAPTFIPGRNLVFLSHALPLAHYLGASTIFIGANASDNVGYPDCRRDFFNVFNFTARLAGLTGTVRTPIIDMDKTAIVKMGIELGVNFAHTSSCYDANIHGPCGHCDSCILRLAAFATNGITDPLVYRS